ncbi:unnamed protein product [Linum trigynum]|uniref:Uncharacterized protein n=1 Tax=Linum trigynum TaxID=586398 RepID=A0AAV2D706_9ROSI
MDVELSYPVFIQFFIRSQTVFYLKSKPKDWIGLFTIRSRSSLGPGYTVRFRIKPNNPDQIASPTIKKSPAATNRVMFLTSECGYISGFVVGCRLFIGILGS